MPKEQLNGFSVTQTTPAKKMRQLLLPQNHAVPPPSQRNINSRPSSLTKDLACTQGIMSHIFVVVMEVGLCLTTRR